MVSTKILLVDDDKKYTGLISLMLEKLRDFNFKVTVAESEENAWEQIRKEEHFDVFLIDLQLDEDDPVDLFRGFDLAEALKKNEGTKDIPIIFISSIFQDDNDERLKRLGNDFYSKSFDIELLIKKITAAMSKNINI